MESIGSSLRFEGELIWAGLDWRGPDIRSGLVNRHLIKVVLILDQVLTIDIQSKKVIEVLEGDKRS